MFSVGSGVLVGGRIDMVLLDKSFWWKKKIIKMVYPTCFLISVILY